MKHFNNPNPIVWQNSLIWNPGDELLAAAGYQEIPEKTENPPAPVIRYSKLALYDLLGPENWDLIESRLSPLQKQRLNLANELSSDDPDFSALFQQLSSEHPELVEALAAAAI